MVRVLTACCSSKRGFVFLPVQPVRNTYPFLNFVMPLSTVIWKPVFSINPGDRVVEEGRDAIFECEATGSPRPKITWLRDNSLLLNSTLIRNGSISYLVLRSVKKEQNSGMYQCIAVNIVGRTQSKKGMLTVTSKEPEMPTANPSPLDGENNVRCSFSNCYTLIFLNS